MRCARSGWTVFNGTRLGQCLRSFADANPFLAMRVDPDMIDTTNDFLANIEYRLRARLPKTSTDLERAKIRTDDHSIDALTSFQMSVV